MATIWLVPLALAGFGSALFCAAWLVSRRFDRKYPHLSREGMREAEQRDEVERRAGLRTQIPVPPFRPEEWSMRPTRDEFDSERLDRSLSRWGEQVARHPNQASEDRTMAPR
ncbi:hypothetical protein [Lichenibacterium dinghuense]|uniref:hypothetical protein n=1 Tax=Lichenibacterium dinghuense TaxID=2895977 RepID=UPI001F2E541E|nr:hypothetical protein [Lichenibacterium sp. 6Y81]